MLRRALPLATVLLLAACAGAPPMAPDAPLMRADTLTPPVATVDPAPEATPETAPGSRGATRGAVSSSSGTQRAMLVGINTYNPPGAVPQEREFADLTGPTNDLRLMREVLVERYGFQPENIETLTDEQATREGILSGIAAWIDSAAPGDHLTFYFSGHGSQVDTTREVAGEGDRKLETIVPYDAALGASDIADKDLRRLWNRALDRVQGEEDTGTGSLTIIQDNCNSGSGARGPRRARKVAAPARVDIGEGPVGRVPASRGALVLAAAQDDESAMELYIRGEYFGGIGGQHGGFTASLVRALRALPVGAPASLVMEQSTSYLRLLDLTQEPDATGPVSRPLFGAPLAPGGGLAFAVESVDDDGHVILRGGSLAGLGEDATLAQALDDAPEATLRVTDVLGPSRSRAEVTSGTGVTEGDLFRPTSLTFPPGTELTVWLPPSVADDAALAQASGAPCPSTCTDALGAADTPGPVELPSASGWTPYTIAGAAPEASVYRPLPPTAAFRALVASELASSERVTVVDDPRGADYWLAGEATAGGTDYRWVRRRAAETRDEALTLPAFMGTVPADAGGAVALANGADRLAKAKLWALGLTAPEVPARVASGEVFPVEILGVQRVSDGLVIRPDPVTGVLTLPPGDADDDAAWMRLAIGLSPEALDDHLAAPILQRQDARYGYALVVSPDGSGCLVMPWLFCETASNAADLRLDLTDASRLRLAPTTRGDSAYVFDLDAGNEWIFADPPGRHTLVLLTSVDRVDNEATLMQWPAAAEGAGAKGRSPQGRRRTLPQWGLRRLTLDIIPGAASPAD